MTNTSRTSYKSGQTIRGGSLWLQQSEIIKHCNTQHRNQQQATDILLVEWEDEIEVFGQVIKTYYKISTNENGKCFLLQYKKKTIKE